MVHIFRLSDAQYEMWDPFKGHNAHAWVRRWQWLHADIGLKHQSNMTMLYHTQPHYIKQGSSLLWQKLGYHFPQSHWSDISRVLLDHSSACKLRLFRAE